MVIVKVHYGLGNQLFQYALAKSLSLRNGWDFRLDTGFFKTDILVDHPRVYQLDRFNIEERIASPDEVESFTKPSFLKRRWRSMTNRFLANHQRRVVNEIKLDFDENIFNVNDNSYLFGFWQDYRYFSSIGDLLKKELTFKNEPTGLNRLMLDRIKATNAVSLHIRRGDYLTDTYVAENVGICDLDYYRNAVAEMAQSVSSPVFYIFSDDPAWVKDNFNIPYDAVYIDHNPEEMAFEDLRLMSGCRHHITANSSFSWWGAWLAGNEDKIVITPRIWRSKGPSMFLPPGWKAV